MYDDEPKPTNNIPLTRLYNLVCSLLSSISPDTVRGFLKDGSGDRFNGYVDQFIQMTSDTALNDFKVKIITIQGDNAVRGEEYARKMSALAQYLFSTNEVIGYYCGGPPQPNTGPGAQVSLAPTTVNNHLQSDQNAIQSTEVRVEITQQIVALTEALTNFERDHPDEMSKENQFAKKLKEALPMVKNGLDIVALALKIAGEIGINPHIALKALGLG